MPATYYYIYYVTVLVSIYLVNSRGLALQCSSLVKWVCSELRKKLALDLVFTMLARTMSPHFILAYIRSIYDATAFRRKSIGMLQLFSLPGSAQLVTAHVHFHLFLVAFFFFSNSSRIFDL